MEVCRHIHGACLQRLVLCADCRKIAQYEEAMMPVYEARMLVQAESEAEARGAIRVPNTPHTEPVLSQWGYYSQLDEKSAGIYRSTLPPVKSKEFNPEGPVFNRKSGRGRAPGFKLTEEQKAKMRAGREAKKQRNV